MTTTFATILLRRDTASSWTSSNPVLVSGQMGMETDTGLFKIGDGSTAWNSLGYSVAKNIVNATVGAATPASGDTVLGLISGVLKRFAARLMQDTWLGGVTGEVARTLYLKLAERVTLADFGVVSDGTDQRAKVQAAIDWCAANGVKNLYGDPSKVISIAKNGTNTKTYLSAVSGTFTGAYCLEHKNRVFLRGMSLLLMAGNDAALLTNQNPSTGGDGDLGFSGCTFDGNSVTTQNALLMYQQVTNCDFDDSTIKRSGYYGMFLTKSSACRLGTIGRLWASTTLGSGFQLGGNTVHQNSDLEIGDLYVDHCIMQPTNAFNDPGNPIVIGAVNWTARLLKSYICEGGIKIGPGCDNFQIDKVYFDTSSLNSPNSLLDQTKKSKNSGLKFEGEPGNLVQNGQVTEVFSTNCGGRGIALEYCNDVQVDRYLGVSNGQSDAGPDNNRTAVTTPDPDIIVDMGSSLRIRLGYVATELAGGQGLSTDDQYSAGLVGRIDIGSYFCRNCGQNPTSNSIGNSSGFSHINGDLNIDHLRVVDDQVTKTVGKGFECGVTSDVRGRIGEMQLVGISFPLDIRNNLISLGPVLFNDTAAMFGNIVLSVGTSSFIDTANFRLIHLGSYWTEPMIRLEPMNAAAAALMGSMRITYVNGEATLHHATAAGGEPVRWTLVGYQQSTVQMA